MQPLRIGMALTTVQCDQQHSVRLYQCNDN
jgi:hypothetical protein